MRRIVLLFIVVVYSCGNVATKKEKNDVVQHPEGMAFPSSPSKVGAIEPPQGFIRTSTSEGSYTHYLRSLSLDTLDNVVHLYNGEEKINQSAHFAILTIDVGERDLQQCADAVMRLRAEYLYSNHRLSEIGFLFTNGEFVPYSKYSKGYRPFVHGNDIEWRKTHVERDDYSNFRSYMDLVFIYAGSHSLSRQLQYVVDFDDIQPGDVLIQGGFPGHAVVVMDIAIREETGQKVYMLAQSYMPAQEIHILVNPEKSTRSPWYEISENEVINTPQWQFVKSNLMRFPSI